jgi:hypothetical protein
MQNKRMAFAFRSLLCKPAYCCTSGTFFSHPCPLPSFLQAENSDVGAQPNPYRLLFAFHSVRHNWRQAAAAMHRFAERVAEEVPVTAASVRIQAEVLLAATSALRLLPQDSAWLPGETHRGQPGPSKRPRIAGEASERCSAKG